MEQRSSLQESEAVLSGGSIRESYIVVRQCLSGRQLLSDAAVTSEQECSTVLLKFVQSGRATCVPVAGLHDEPEGA